LHPDQKMRTVIPPSLSFFMSWHFSDHRNQNIFVLIAWPLKMGPICSPETSVSHYKFMLCNIPEERKGKYPLTLPLHSFSISILSLYTSITVTLSNDGRNSRPKHVAVNVMNKIKYGYL
jgi:hypothetical protein